MAWPLEGIQVLDLCSYIAGPYCPALVGDLGAEKIKIEAHWGDQTRDFPLMLQGETQMFLGRIAISRGSCWTSSTRRRAKLSRSSPRPLTWRWRIFAPASRIGCRSATSSCQPSTRTWSMARLMITPSPPAGHLLPHLSPFLMGKDTGGRQDLAPPRPLPLPL